MSASEGVQADALFLLFKLASVPDGVEFLHQLPQILCPMVEQTLLVASQSTEDDLRINSLGKDTERSFSSTL